MLSKARDQLCVKQQVRRMTFLQSLAQVQGLAALWFFFICMSFYCTIVLSWIFSSYYYYILFFIFVILSSFHFVYFFSLFIYDSTKGSEPVALIVWWLSLSVNVFVFNMRLSFVLCTVQYVCVYVALCSQDKFPFKDNKVYLDFELLIVLPSL